jgi:hypothetical protein
MRRHRRLARKYRAVNNDPPAQADGDAATKLRTAVQQLRQTARADPGIDELCDSIEQGLGGYVRHGGGEAVKPRPMPPEWGGSPEPPEIS